MTTKKINNDQRIKGSVTIDVNLTLSGLTASRVPVLDGSKNVTASSVTSTELGYLSGVTSAIQTQLGSKIDSSEKGVALGVATLDGSGKIPSSQLPSSVFELKGAWNASTNSPTLADNTGNAGDVYKVTTAGTQNLGSGSIPFAVNDLVIYGADGIWFKSDSTDDVLSVNGQQGVVVLDTDDISEGTTNLYFTDERAQDAVGGILTDTASVDLTYNDGSNQISATVLPAGVDHNQLQNYSANRHIDHSAVSIATASDSGLTGGGDITTTRNLSVDINGTTAETSNDDNDKILIWDNSASALKSMTRANFLSGISIGSVGDIQETSFSAANNQTSAADVTGLAFANATVRSFEALISVTIDASADLFETFKLVGIQRGADWQLISESVGDDSGLVFSITNTGQVQYTSTNVAGFVSNTIKFRAITTTV